jgi:hypothetical protein
MQQNLTGFLGLFNVNCTNHLDGKKRISIVEQHLLQIDLR